MKLATPSVLGFALICFAAAPASSQDFSFSTVDWTHEIDLDLGWTSDRDLPRDRALYADLRVRFDGEVVHSAQTRYGIRVHFGAVSSDGTRGGFVDLPCTDNQSCPSVLGIVSGLSSLPGIDPAEDRAGLAIAEFYLRRPFYELRAGRTSSALDLQSEPAARAMKLFAADNDRLGPGLAMTEASLGESALGASLTLRRLAGISASLSYGHENDTCTLSVCRFSAPQNGLGTLEHIWSGAVSYVHTRQGWRAELGVQTAALTGSISGYNDPWLVRGLVSKTQNDITVSLKSLLSNNGLSVGDYAAWSLGLATEQGDWLWSAELGFGRDDAFDAEGFEAVLAGSRFITDSLLFSAGVEVSDAYGDAEINLVSEIGLRF